jgi:uncharacterized protein (TIGR02611 family)
VTIKSLIALIFDGFQSKGVVGSTILAIGVVMMVLPGPAFIVIPIGVGILATEFAWAKRLLRKVEGKIHEKTGTTEHNDKSG